MAEKRMFSNKVIGTDSFLEMPDSSQNLYFHLSMSADDDGFVDKWKSIMRMTSKKEDDLKILIAKSFIIPFESGVVVIKDWRINNYIQKDRYKPTIYTEELTQLIEEKNRSYTKCIQNGHLDKISIDKNSIYSLSATKEENEKQEQDVQPVRRTDNDYNTTFKAKENIVSTNNKVSKEVVSLSRDKTKEKEIEDIFDYWNSKQIIVHKTLTEETQKAILKMRKKYAVEEIKQMMDRYKQVLENGKYFFNYKWSLKDFLSQKNAAVDFAEDGSKWQDYCNKTGTAVNNYTQTQINNQKKVAEGVFKI